MAIRVLVTGLALGLGGILLGAGCSQQDPEQRATAVEEQKVGSLDSAARTGSAVRDAEAPDWRVDEPAGKAMAERVEGIVEEGVEREKISIEVAGKESRDAYEAARARAKDSFRDALERRNR